MIDLVIPTDIIQSINTQQAWHYLLLPFAKSDTEIRCYIAKENHHGSLEEELEVLLGIPVVLEITPTDELKKAIAQYYRKPTDSRSQPSAAGFDINDSQNILNNLIKEAKMLNSSDIHLEPYEHKARIRVRIDGKLVERYNIDIKQYPSLVNKIKIQSSLDISEKRLPQDGRIFIKNESLGQLDLRVSVLPTLHGEKIVLRILGSDNLDISMEQLGFGKSDLALYLESVHRPSGIVLVSGPTGSGKTTTLYATLQLLNQSIRNILTIEDPIEYTLEGINQVQLKENIGLDFPAAMRTFLRQDPDIITVGEIRDKSTAEMAIRASLTGHLVLSTIHTNSAWGIVARLVDMGIPSYLLADTLNAAVAQRLVRLLCNNCKTATSLDKKAFPRGFKTPNNLKSYYVANGCEDCFYTGYRGRKAIYEIIPIDETLSFHIKQTDMNVKQILTEKGHASLADNALKLVSSGLTSPEEVYPILSSS